VSRNRFCDFLTDPDSRSFSGFYTNIHRSRYRKYGDLWLVELLFDDLLDWNNWSLRDRTMEPLDLIVLGTSQATQNIMNGMQSARYESGLDK
jgi:hypothetical protein